MDTFQKEETFKAAEIAVDNALRIDKDFCQSLCF